MRLIDATPILQEFIKIADMCEGKNPYENVKIKAYRRCFERIADAPTVNAVPVVHGRLIVRKTAAGALYTVCSLCKTSVKYKDEYGLVVMDLRGAKYCPNCGAKMDEVSE